MSGGAIEEIREEVAVESYLRARIPALLPGHPALRALAPLAPEVWRVDLGGALSLVAKHQPCGFFTRGRPFDLLQVEKTLLALLRRGGCPVPRVLALDPEAQFIFTEYLGDRTLDDLAQEEGTAACRSCLRRLIAGLGAIARTCALHRETLAPCVAPGAGAGPLRRNWEQAGRLAQQGLDYFLPSGPRRARGRALLAEIHAWLGARSPTLGSSDYNARNVVVGPAARPHFIEFAKIGWDWTERRLVQYTTSMGSKRPQGRFISLLDARSVQFYARCSAREDSARALDGHHLVFQLNAAARLGAALAAPHRTPNARLLRAWRRPRQRRAQLLAQLGVVLSADPRTAELRALFRRAPFS